MVNLSILERVVAFKVFSKLKSFSEFRGNLHVRDKLYKVHNKQNLPKC